MMTAATNTNGNNVVRSFAPPVTLAFDVAALLLLAMVDMSDAPITMLISSATKIPPDSALLNCTVGMLPSIELIASDSPAGAMAVGIVRQSVITTK